MTYIASVANVLIAYPRDASQERDIIRDQIRAWNAAHSRDRKIVLEPVEWETHSMPDASGPAQLVINKQILHQADLLIAVFKNTLGTPTTSYKSGTVEELERHLSVGKQVMIYFSSEDIPRNHDEHQLKALESFKAWCREKYLYFDYKDHETLRREFTRHIAARMQPGGGLIPCPGGILATLNVSELAGYNQTEILSKTKSELVIAGPTLQSWLSTDENRRHFIDLVKKNKGITISFILGTINIIRELGPGEEGVRGLRESASNLRKIRDKMSKTEKDRMKIYFDSGATTLSAVFIDPDTADGILFFTPRWGRDYQPNIRLTCLINKQTNPELFRTIWNDNIRLSMRVPDASNNLDTMLTALGL
jgi:hypothetical protein